VKAHEAIGQVLDAQAAEALGLVTFALDDIDWADEIRVFLEERASFSADSAKIAFACWNADSYGLYTIKPDGTGLTTVLTQPDAIDTPVFSPDGTKILYVDHTPAPGAARSAKVKFDRTRHAHSKAGHRQAVPGIPAGSVVSVNLDGSGATSLLSNTYEIVVLNSNLFFTAYDSDLGFEQIYKADLDGANAVSISDGTTYDWLDVAWF